jgi:RNA polymerase sigma-70 factor (ECF subfamily)
VEAERAPAQATVAAEADGDLVRRLLQGDASAHPEFCSRYGPALHRFAVSRLGGDQDAADDIVLEALTDGLRNIRRFDAHKSTLHTWLHGIARHRIQRERRRQRKSTSPPPSAVVSLDASGHDPPGDDIAPGVAERLEARQKVAHLATVLSDTEMEILTLRCVGEFSTKEIARIVRRSERAVETLFLRAKRKARESLTDHAH